MEIKYVANSYLLMALILGALLPVMLYLSKGMNTGEFLLVTYAISTPSALAFAVAMGKRKKIAEYISNKKTFATIAFIGLLNYAFLEYGLTYAERFVSASLATVVYRSYPLLMLLFLPVILRERITKHQVAALLLGFAGLYLALTGGTLLSIKSGEMEIILFLIVIAMASAIATILVKKYMFDMETSMFIFNLANLVFFAVFFIASGAPLSPILPKELIPILYVGIVYNVLTGFMYYSALRMLKTTFVTNIYFLSPFITFLFAYAILGEAIKIYYVAIAVLVAIGIIIQNFDKIGGTYRARKRQYRFTIFDVSGAFANTGDIAISKSLDTGGRVLAVRLAREHAEKIQKVLADSKYEGIIVDLGNYDTNIEEDRKREYRFVREIVGAEPEDIVIMKVGDTKEGENFFSTLEQIAEPATGIQNNKVN